MSVLFIIPDHSINQDRLVEALIAGGLDKRTITPSPYRDSNLFLSDPSFQVIFIEIDEQSVNDSLPLLDKIKVANSSAKIIPILHSKNSDIILQLVKKGIADILVFPFQPDEIGQIISQIDSTDNFATAIDSSSSGKVIGVSSYKGGTGVSTIVSNLGFCLSELPNINKKVLILDLSNQSNHCARLLGANITLTIHELAQNIDDIGTSYIHSSCSWITDNLAIIGSSLSLDSLVEGVDFDKLSRCIQMLATSFDYVLIDIPTHTFDSRFLASVECSSQILIASTLDITSIIDTQNYIQVIRELGVDPNKIRILINRYDAQTGLFNAQDLERAFEHPVSFYVRNDYLTMTKASQEQVSIVESNPSSILAEDLTQLAIGIDNGSNFVPIKRSNTKRNKGLIGNLLDGIKS